MRSNTRGAVSHFLRLAIVAWLAGGTEDARATELVPLTSAELLSRLKNNPRIEAQRARIDRARAAAIAAGVFENPSLSFQREEVGRSPEHFATVELPLQISGRRGKSVEAAEANVRATEADVARELLLIQLDALDLYYTAAATRARVDVLQNMRSALELRWTELRRRTGAGDASGFELGRLDIELATHDDLLAEQQTELIALQHALAVLADERDRLIEPSETITATMPPSLAALLEGAFEQRADHRAARERKESAELALSAAGRGWIPSLIVSGGLKSAELEDETRFGYVAALGFTLPLFDRGQADRARAAADLRESSAELQRLEREIPAELTRAHQTLSSDVTRVRRFEADVMPKLDALVRRAEAAYREGERPVFELLDAYRTARENRLRHVDLLLRAKRSELELRRALGETK